MKYSVIVFDSQGTMQPLHDSGFERLWAGSWKRGKSGGAHLE